MACLYTLCSQAVVCAELFKVGCVRYTANDANLGFIGFVGLLVIVVVAIVVTIMCVKNRKQLEAVYNARHAEEIRMGKRVNRTGTKPSDYSRAMVSSSGTNQTLGSLRRDESNESSPGLSKIDYYNSQNDDNQSSLETFVPDFQRSSGVHSRRLPISDDDIELEQTNENTREYTRVMGVDLSNVGIDHLRRSVQLHQGEYLRRRNNQNEYQPEPNIHRGPDPSSSSGDAIVNVRPQQPVLDFTNMTICEEMTRNNNARSLYLQPIAVDGRIKSMYPDYENYFEFESPSNATEPSVVMSNRIHSIYPPNDVFENEDVLK